MSLNILYKIKPNIFMRGKGEIYEAAVTYGCVHSSRDLITENCCLLPNVE